MSFSLLIADEDEEKLSTDVDKERLKFKNEFEDTIADKILSLLQPSYGTDGVNVAVTADFNYDKKVSDDVKYTPSVGDNGMIQHQDESSASGQDTPDGGTVGVEPNADGTYPTEDSTTDGTSWQESSKSTDYLVNTLKEQTEKKGYSVEEVTVSVIVYKNNMTEEEKTKIMNTVSKASGTEAGNVSVENLPKFEDKPIEEEPTGPSYNFV